MQMHFTEAIERSRDVIPRGKQPGADRENSQIYIPFRIGRAVGGVLCLIGFWR
jgi:hypothetical protein